MPKYYRHKGHNKQTWQFRKTHPQLRIYQKETQVRIDFFDQINQLIEKQANLSLGSTLTPAGTPPQTAEALTSKQTTTPKQTVEPRTKPAKATFGRRYKSVMVDLPIAQGHTQTVEQVMTVANYLKAVKAGNIPKSPNHAAIQEMSKKPHGTQMQVIVLACKPTQ